MPALNKVFGAQHSKQQIGKALLAPSSNSPTPNPPMFSIILSYLQPFVCGARSKKPKAAPQTFPLFPLLPTELRLRIWSFALHCDAKHLSPRQISLYRYNPRAKRGFSKISLSKKYPTLFSVNREARHEASRLLGGEWMDIDRGWTGIKETVRVYVDFEKDAVLLRGCEELFVRDERGVRWKGHLVVPWRYGRNLESKAPIYVAGAKIWETLGGGEKVGRTMLE